MTKFKQKWHLKGDPSLVLTFVMFGTGPSDGVVAYMEPNSKMKQDFSYSDVAYLKQSPRVIGADKLEEVQ